MDESPDALAPAPASEGPRVVFDVTARLAPDVPFPNDLLTRPDSESPTGRRLDLPSEASTATERALRRGLLKLDGFSPFGPITVRFDAPLDAEALHGRGRPYDEDPVLLLDLTEGETFGERVPLDLGRGNFPIVLPDPDAYFDHDPRAGASNLLYETVDEDLDNNGVLDPLEDTDGDGVLDRPNVSRPGGDPVDELLDFYEAETRTLILRPVVPLRGGHTYAVVLTRGLVGRDGEPVRSPFPNIHHTRQKGPMLRLTDALAPHGVPLGEVAFTWTFTTQTATRLLQDLRHGLQGQGIFADLAGVAPPDITFVEALKDRGERNPLLLRSEQLKALIKALGDVLLDAEPGEVVGVTESLDAVDYLVSGRFVTPYFLAPEQIEEGAEPGPDHDFAPGTRFRVDPVTGEIGVVTEDVPFWCVIPKARPEADPPLGPPWPVVLYAHGAGRTGFEVLRVAGPLAQWGLATCGIDAAGHGAVLPPEVEARFDEALGTGDPEEAPDLEMAPFKRVFQGLRARDLNNDGRPDPGGDTFTTDAFHTRDMVRQTAMDWLQFIKVLRALNGQRRWRLAGATTDVAGDFDSDGVVDLGGPDVRYTMMGRGYGGFVATLVSAVAPEIEALAVLSGGGGLTDISARSTQPGVLEAGILRAMGPLVLGDPPLEGFTTVRFFTSDVTGTASLPFAQLPPLVPGDRVVLTNLDSGVQGEGVVDGRGAFRVAVPTDAVPATRVLEVLRGLRDPGFREPPPWALGACNDQVDPACRPEVLAFGSRLMLEVFSSTGRPKDRITTFQNDVTFNGLIYPQEAPLVAVSSGWGLKRQTPDFRQFLMLTQTGMAPADPINYIRLLTEGRRELVTPSPAPMVTPPIPPEGLKTGAPVLIMATAGDTRVPVASALSLARAAGVLQVDGPGAADARYDRTPNELLIDFYVAEGLARLERFGQALFDIDDLSDGTDEVVGTEGQPRRLSPPLRLTRAGPEGQAMGLRVGVLDAQGSHAFGGPQADKPWDGASYLIHLTGRFLTGGGLDHSPCLATGDCPDMPPAPASGE